MPSRDNAEFYHCTGVRVQTGVWYHVAWSYDSGVSGGTGAADLGEDFGGQMSLFVNGRQRRRIAVSADLDLGSNYRHGDGGGRVSLFAHSSLSSASNLVSMPLCMVAMYYYGKCWQPCHDTVMPLILAGGASGDYDGLSVSI